jgi:signal recognition particle receptor subunit beta
MKYIYDHFRARLTVPSIVGVTKQDINGAASIHEISQCFGADDILVMGCDPREKKDSKVLVLSLLEIITCNKEGCEESEFF